MAETITNIIPEETSSLFTPSETSTDTTTQDTGVLAQANDIYNIPTTATPPTYNDYVPPSLDDVTVPKADDYITPEVLVSTQFNKLIAEDSPLIQQARQRANEVAQSRGILSSTSGIRLGDRAAYEAAMPIAQADAATIGKFKQAEYAGALKQSEISSEGVVSAALNKYQAGLNQTNQNINNAFTLALQKADSKMTYLLEEQRAKWNEDTQLKLQEFQQAFDEKIKANEIGAQQYNAAMNSANGIMQNTQSAITNLMANPDIMSQDPNDVKQMFNNIIDQGMASIEFISSVGGIDSSNFNTILANYKSAMAFN